MGSALLDATTLDQSFSGSTGHPHAPLVSAPPESHIDLKIQVARRLAAHRDRRDRLHPRPPVRSPSKGPIQPSPGPSSSAARAARIAAAVAERYARSPSYRAYLAAEADRAIREAHAAAEAAALNARAVAAAQEQLLADLDSARLDLAELDSDGARCNASRSDPVALCTAHDSLQESLPTEEPAPTLTLRPPPGRPPHASTKASRHRAPVSHDAAKAELTSAPAPSAQDRGDDSAAGLTVFLYEDIASSNLPVSTIAPASASQRLIAAALAASRSELRAKHEEQNAEEARALDEEIAFRRAPVFEEPAGPPTPLPANLIEFPRQLVAPRKARPRGAEGPLRDDSMPGSGDSQLRIFEVDPAQICTNPEAEDAATPQWTSLWLEAPAHSSDSGTNADAPSSAAQATRRTWESTHSAESADPRTTPHPRPQTATITKRFIAAAIDGSLILASFVASTATFALVSLHAAPAAGTHPQELLAGASAFLVNHAGVQSSTGLGAIAAAIVCLYVLYQLLFFSFSEATPGMRCARIALCTFADENPTRPAMRRRILAVLLSACPLGLGFLWAALDEDRLAWHDLISRMYQRSY
jgi:uncharacterized RDD family membrane protein YckC